MSRIEKMICHQCGIAMNHHAEKMDFDAGFREPDAADPDFGAVIEEYHVCAKCGTSASRRAPLSEAAYD